MKVKRLSALRWSLLATWIVACAVGLYFRTYTLHGIGTTSPERAKKIAQDLVTQKMREQIRPGIEQRFPGLDARKKKELLDQQIAQIIRVESGKYNEAVENAKNQISVSRTPKQSRRYLLEADPYLYYGLTENIVHTGSIGAAFKDGRFFNPLRVAPKGVWSFVTLHPYVGYLIYIVLNCVNPGIDLMDAVAYVPLFLMVISAMAFFYCGGVLGQGVTCILMGCLTLLLSPIYIQRGAYGWYDTDPYNYIFPLLIFSTFFQSFGKNRKQATLAGILGGLLTGIYPLFWVGWPFVLGLVIFAGIAVMTVSWWLKTEEVKSTRSYLLAYLISSGLFLICSLTPRGFYESMLDALTVLPQLSTGGYDVWPNVFVSVGETRSISFLKLVYLTGNFVTYGVAILGLAASLFSYRREKNIRGFLQWVALATILLPLLFLSLRTERFSLLFVMPLAFFVMLGTGEIMRFCTWILNQIPYSWVSKYPKRIRTVSAMVAMAVILPMQVLFAHGVALGVEPIMNDTWFDSLKQIQLKTPRDSVIYSWWPPGHFITGISQRKVASDGASQHLPECYWLARFFMAENEREGMGILRMLYFGGNSALEFLQNHGYEITPALELLKKIIVVDRAAALTELKKIKPPLPWDQFLDLTHGRVKPGPAYIYLYNDMIESNLAISVMARWNFDKARQMREAHHSPAAIIAGMKNDYIRNMVSISDGFLKYTAEAPVIRQEGDDLIFSNGLKANLKTSESFLDMPSKKVRGKPLSFFVMKDGVLIEIKNTGDLVNVSALVYEDRGQWFSLVADGELIQSLLFRLYYCRGRGLSSFKPWYEKQDVETRTTIKLYEVDWQPQTTDWKLEGTEKIATLPDENRQE